MATATPPAKLQYECRNALYFKANDNSGDDMVLVKEYIHLPDGTTKPNLRQILNYQREVYIHKEGYRKYKTKQVYKPKSEMQVYRTTEAKLLDTIKMALGIPLGRYMSKKQLCRSPYIYGCDITTPCLIKKKYKEAFPNAKSLASVAVLDIETSVVTRREEIIAVSLSYKKKAILATTRDFLGTTPLPKEKFYEYLDKLTPDVRGKRGCEVEFFIADTPALAVIEVLKRAHEWKPDFIIGWNLMGFDIPKIISELEIEGYDPANVFSDPSIHPRFRMCRYHRGQQVQRTNAGIERPLANYEQWHWLNTPASFFFIDAMCLYYQLRRGGPLEENYKLETILQKHIGMGKLGIKEAEHLDGIDLHRFMQERHKIEYLVYNLFDCIGLEMLDEKTTDCCTTMPIMASISELGYYTSNPRRLADELHFYVQEDKDFDGVLGTVSDQMKTELDTLVPGLDGWVVALPTERLQDTGLANVVELPGMRTKVHGQSADIDVSSGYPNIERSMNMSKDTTVHELNRIEGLSVAEQRVIGLNILGGKSNSISVATKLYRLPQPTDMYNSYLRSKGYAVTDTKVVY